MIDVGNLLIRLWVPSLCIYKLVSIIQILKYTCKSKFHNLNKCIDNVRIHLMILYSLTSFQLDYTTLTEFFYNKKIFEPTQEYQMAPVHLQSN
jgi:hypothetical protein